MRRVIRIAGVVGPLESQSWWSVENKPPEHSLLAYGNNTLWGIAGGQLEYVSQRIKWQPIPHTQRWQPVMVIRFTDHDCQASPNPNLIEGKYYELEFPLAAY